jgi:hypothetical protein
MHGDNIMDINFWWIALGFICFWAVTLYIRNFTNVLDDKNPGEKVEGGYKPGLYGIERIRPPRPFPPAVPPLPPTPKLNVFVNVPPLTELTKEQRDSIRDEFKKKFTNLDYRTIYTGRLTYNSESKEWRNDDEKPKKNPERKITFK